MAKKTEINFNNNCAVITGGSSGIGKAIAVQFLQRGANVLLVARREEILCEAVRELETNVSKNGQKLGYYAGDIGDINHAKEAIELAEKEYGPVNVLINSAGTVTCGCFNDLPVTELEREINVNYMGAMYMSKQVVANMIKRRQGWIVNVASLGGVKGLYGYAGYCASKFAIIGFSEALRSELRLHGIQVSVLAPADVDTPMYRNAAATKTPEQLALSGPKPMLADDVARIFMKDMQKDKFMIIPGTGTKLLAAACRYLPYFIDRWLNGVVDKIQKQTRKKEQRAC